MANEYFEGYVEVLKRHDESLNKFNKMNAKCKLLGHKWKIIRTYFGLASYCKRCGKLKS